MPRSKRQAWYVGKLDEDFDYPLYRTWAKYAYAREAAERVEELNALNRESDEQEKAEVLIKQVQTSGPKCKGCGAFTTYKRVNTHGLCMKCEGEARKAGKL